MEIEHLFDQFRNRIEIIINNVSLMQDRIYKL